MVRTTIEWTSSCRPDGTIVPGYTFNPWVGCTKISPGCVRCYAENLMDTRWKRVTWGRGNPRLRTSETNWRQPLVWDRASGKRGRRTAQSILCVSGRCLRSGGTRRMEEGSVLAQLSGQKTSIGYCSQRGRRLESSSLAFGRPSIQKPRARFGSGSQPRINDDLTSELVNRKATGNILDGRQWLEMPVLEQDVTGIK